MYSTCLYCNIGLGRNEEIEALPVGRRLAYDQGRGRLWVVCRACGRWNLTPFDERWEAIEACEKAFRATTVRISSDNISLARISEGLELIRIGAPLLPEFAAWRYGGQFLRRHRRRLLTAAGRIGGIGVFGLGALVAPLVGSGALLAAAGTGALLALKRMRKPDLVVSLDGGRQLRLSHHQVLHARLLVDDTIEDGWSLQIDHLDGEHFDDSNRMVRQFAREATELQGDEARSVAALVLPRLNPLGGNESSVSDALHWLEAAGGAERAFRNVAYSPRVRPALDAAQCTFATMHPGVRLALEMALHEDDERRALGGQLSALRFAWKEAERLAAIADRLGVSDEVEQQLALLRNS